MIGDNNYGDVYADIFDDLFAGRDDLDLISGVLARYAGSGSALEMGIGTGRIALPLAGRGVKVYGMDNSALMLEKLRQKPDGDKIVAQVGDFAVDRMTGDFTLVYIVSSTLYMLGSQETQVRCLRNCAAHLPIGGYLILDGFVHDRTRWSHLQETVTTRIDDDRVGLRVGVLDPVEQLIKIQHIVLSSQGVAMRPIRLRFVYPPEQDLMARLAGFQLRSRWEDWAERPFTAASPWQVSVYQKVADGAI